MGPEIPNYEISEKIGEGPVGEVFRATDLILDREVAIKVLRPEFAAHAEGANRFLVQARALAGLNHPNIATVYTLLSEGGLPVVVTEYVEGRPITVLGPRSGGSRPGHVLPLFLQALDGLGFAHSLGVLHLGLKSSNVMVTPAGTVKLLDFGMSRCFGSTDELRAGVSVETLQYMSPQQLRGHPTDPRSDVYSLAVLLYEMLAGRVPFVAGTGRDLIRAQIQGPPTPLRESAPGLPESLERTLLRALERTPERRFASAEEFRSALERTLPAGDRREEPLDIQRLSTPELITPLRRAAAAGESAEETTQSFNETTQVFDNESPGRDDPIEVGWRETLVAAAGFARDRMGRLVNSHARSWVPIGSAGLAFLLLATVGLHFVLTSEAPPEITPDPATSPEAVAVPRAPLVTEPAAPFEVPEAAVSAVQQPKALAAPAASAPPESSPAKAMDPPPSRDESHKLATEPDDTPRQRSRPAPTTARGAPAAPRRAPRVVREAPRVRQPTSEPAEQQPEPGTPGAAEGSEEQDRWTIRRR